MFDTHAHVNFNAYKDDHDAVMKRAFEKDVFVINVGSQLSTSARAVEMAKQYEKSFAAVGLHPIHLEDMEVEEEHAKFTTRREEFDYRAYRELASQEKVVAIGETGVDFFHTDGEDKIAKQKQVFVEHIKLANEMKLPLIVHCRGKKENIGGAYADVLKILQEHKPKAGGVMHCYVGPAELLKSFLDLGFYIGFNGVLTFDKTGTVEKALLATPIDRVLTETDCPYLTPPPFRGKRNEPAYVEYVVGKIADLLELPVEEVKRKTDENARQLFGI